jgi:hypothetical protein
MPHMKGGPHGSSVKNPKAYEALRKDGMPKSRAAAISNAAKGKRGKRSSKRAH